MLKLSDETKRALMGFTASPGYTALVDVMEKLLDEGEKEHWAIDRRQPFVNDSQVLSSQDQCRARREFYEQVQMEVIVQIEHMQAEMKAAESEGEGDGESVPQGN